MVHFRPLFGSRASVHDVHDSFGTTLEAVKTSESEHANPFEQHNKHANSPPHEQPVSPQSQQQQGGNDLAGLLNGAALVSRKDSQSKTQQRHNDDAAVALDSSAPPSEDAAGTDLNSPDNAAAWLKSRNQAETWDQHESARARSKLGRTLKKVDAKIRSTIGVNAPPTTQQIRSPYSIGKNDHLTSQDNFAVAELLDEASLETLQHLSTDEDDDDGDDEDEVEDEDEAEVQQNAQLRDQHVNDNDDGTTLREPQLRSDPDKIKGYVDELNQVKQGAKQRRSGSMDGARPGDTVRTRAPVEFSADEKIKAIIEEFGECASASEPNEPEKLIVDHNAVLMKTVLIRGNLFLTSRRVCFLAYIPDAAGGNSNSSDYPHPGSVDIRAPSDPNVENPILQSGPAILHRLGKLRPKRRVWLELRKDSFNAYSASNKLYKPLLSARLANMHAVLPIDWSQPNVIRFVEGTTYSSVEFKTQEAALEWRKELEAAAFHARNTAEKVRISIPLERIVGIDAADFMRVAKVLHIDVLVGAVNDDEVLQIEQENRERTGRHQLDRTWSTSDAFFNCPKNPGFKCHVTQVTFGVTHNRSAFIDLLREALTPSRSIQHSTGYKNLLSISPAPLLDLQGEPDVEDVSTDSSYSSDDHKSSLADKFCDAFALPHRPDELHIVKAELVRTLHTHGTIAIGLDYLLFWRRAVGRELKIKVPLNDLRGVDTYRSMFWHHFGLVVHITAHSDMYFDFASKDNRDMTLHKLAGFIQAKRKQSKEGTASHDAPATEAKGDHKSPEAVQNMPGKKVAAEALLHDDESEVPVFEPDVLAYLPKVVNMDRNAMRDSIRISPMRIYCLTIGSRGDVQPYIALCKALKEHGHTPVIVSHPEYRSWVEGHGIEYRGVGGDPAALMKLSVEHRIFSPAFFKESIGKFRVWLDELLRECWEECQGADLLIESPSTMAGIHVAEGLSIPYFRAFTMPWTKTSAYPQAFSVPSIEMGPSYNSSSYTLFDQVMWVATCGQINRWRKHMVGIGPTDMSKLDADSVPFIYNFSPAVVPMPNDWGDRVKISGYWFLDNPESNWTPPKEMSDFLERARKDGKKIAYIGFGSITIEDAEEVTANIMKAVHQADVRAIVAKGWSGRGGSKTKKKKKQQQHKPLLEHKDSAASQPEGEDAATEEEHEPEIPIPDDVFVVESVPHDWLFPQIDIAMHHGGAGTTGASLRAGLVTLIKPFFGDQFFWANRVQKLGAGARVNGLSVSDISDALKSAASDRVMVEKAQGVGEKIRSENGVATAIEFLYKNIPLANRRTQRKLEREAMHESSTDTSHTRTNPLRRLSSHHRQNSSGGERKDSQHKQQRGATLPTVSTLCDASSSSPTSSREEQAFHRSATIFESPANEAGTPQSAGSSSPTKTSSFLATLNSLNPLPASMTASLKETITLNSSTSDTTADGEEAKWFGERSNTSTTLPGALNVGEESEEHKMNRLKGYKNAKAEDIRRRKLLLERLERERAEKQQNQPQRKEEDEN